MTPTDQSGMVVPAQRFVQGGRYVYSSVLSLHDIDQYLPTRVEAEIAQAVDANRPLTLTHARKIQDYLAKQEQWLSGTMMLGIDPKHIEFQPWQDPAGRAVVAGQLSIRDANVLKMFDGQHRRYAFSEVLKSLRGAPQSKGRLDALEGDSVPIMLYEESRISALRQMFADASKTRNIERNTVAVFDRRNAFNVAADELLDVSDFLSDRVELSNSTVARNNPKIISINQLSSALKVLDVGIKGRVSKERNDEYLANIGELVNRCWLWSDEFLPAARQEYDDLLAGEIDDSEIPGMRSKTMAFNATVLRILAGCYHEWSKDSDDWDPLADYVRASSLVPGTSEGSLLVDAGAVLPGGITPIGRQSQIAATVEYIVRQAKATRN